MLGAVVNSLVRQGRAMARDLWFNGIISSPLVPRPLRWRLLRVSGLAVEPCRIDPGGFVGSTRIEISAGAYLNREVFLDGSDEILIGSGVRIGMRAMIVTSSHEVGDARMRAGRPTTAPVQIGTGTWVGAGATILPGVKIGVGCVIAAGSVVTADCASHGMYAGVPAIRMRDLPVD